MRLEISRRADLAVRALLEIHATPDRIKADELAARLGTTVGFVPQIVGPLVKRGWVRSDPGPRGGYAGAIELDRVSVLEVIEAVDGPTDLGRCVVADGPCGRAPHCALHAAWGRAREMLMAQLDASVAGDAGRSSRTVTAAAAHAPAARSQWQAVAIPSEHGGWGLTLEPAVLGLLVAPSAAGSAIALAALLAFLVRTPLKVVLVDRHRHRALERTHLAARIAGVELVLLVALVGVAVWKTGFEWMVPFAVALPLFGVELWYDARSRGRRLVPELCGAVGITATVAAIVVAGGDAWMLAAALWVVLAARAVASVPFARVQVLRLKSGTAPVWVSDASQLAATVLAFVAWLVDARVGLGACAVVVVAATQLVWSRGPARPAKVVGVWQLGFGLGVVGATAIGVAIA